eukprot:SM000158S02004  [mRNA]  locus=s158:63:3295:+ [translate_table: standard]
MGGDGDRDEASATSMDMLMAPAFIKADQLIGAATTAVLLQMRFFVQKAVQLQAEVHCKHLQYMIDQQQPAASSAPTSSRAAGGRNPLMVGGEAQADLLDGRGRSSGDASSAGGGVKSRKVSTVETEPPGAADTAAKASSCSGGGDAGGHSGGRYGVATGTGPPLPQPSLQPLPLELSQVMERLALVYGNSWSFRVVREVVRPRAAAVLAEVTVGLANAALLFLPSAGLVALEAVHQPAAVPHSSAVQKKATVEAAAALPPAAAAAVAEAVAMEDVEEQASPTCVAPSSLTDPWSSPTPAIHDVNSMTQLNGPTARLSPRDSTDGAATHLEHAASLPTAVAKTSSGGQLAGSVSWRSFQYMWTEGKSPLFVALWMLSWVLIVSNGPDKVMDVLDALDKYCLNAPQLCLTHVEYKVVAWAEVRILMGVKIDALLLDERYKVTNSFHTCQLFRQFEVDHNLPQMPIIGISAKLKRADLEKYAMADYSAIWGNPINERTAGKWICNFLTIYKPPSNKRRAQLKRGDIAEVKTPFTGFMAFV